MLLLANKSIWINLVQHVPAIHQIMELNVKYHNGNIYQFIKMESVQLKLGELRIVEQWTSHHHQQQQHILMKRCSLEVEIGQVWKWLWAFLSLFLSTQLPLSLSVCSVVCNTMNAFSRETILKCTLSCPFIASRPFKLTADTFSWFHARRSDSLIYARLCEAAQKTNACHFGRNCVIWEPRLNLLQVIHLTRAKKMVDWSRWSAITQ